MACGAGEREQEWKVREREEGGEGKGGGEKGWEGVLYVKLLNRKESSLIPTLRSENLANVLTECFSLLQGESYAVANWKQPLKIPKLVGYY